MEEKIYYQAYYYSLEATGERIIDEILKTIALAGKRYHHTEEWIDSIEHEGGKSCVDLIQEAANRAAKEIRQMRDNSEQPHDK